MTNANESELVGVNGTATARKGRAESVQERYRLIWDEAEGTFQVPPLACPYPIGNYIDDSL